MTPTPKLDKRTFIAGIAAACVARTAFTQPAGMDMKGMMKEDSEKMMAMKMTGDPDVDFAMMMRMHHEGGVRMAEAQMKNGKDPAMKAMAKKIAAAQKKEIAQFDAWLAKHGKGHDHGKK